MLIPNYLEKLKQFYGVGVLSNINQTVVNSGVPFPFIRHFGLQINFLSSIEIKMHDGQFELLGGSKQLIQQFGIVILKNACLEGAARELGHRNRFPHLNFHRDRNETLPTPYSLYTRDQRDEEQYFSRKSSTLIIANLVAYLQCMKEQNYEPIESKGIRSHYEIFHNENVEDAIGSVMVEQRWDEPDGVGEIAMLDNRTVLHSSYRRMTGVEGYRIGVRYLC